MSKKFTLEQLTEGIRQRHQGDANARLTEKWARTGLLRGLESVHRENMATLLENQAGQVLRESNTLGGGGLAPSAASGDIRGFTNIAFPIVRRVFGGLVANELVSIQPMSLPSGLLFYLDYTYGTNVGGAESATSNTFSAGDSIYNNPAGKGVRSGSLGVGGQYDLVGTSYSRVHSSSNIPGIENDAGTIFRLGTGTTQVRAAAGGSNTAGIGAQGVGGQNGRFLQFDPQITRLIEEEGGVFSFMTVDIQKLGNYSSGSILDLTAVKEFGLNVTQTLTAEVVAGAGDCALQEIPKTIQGGAGTYNVRRLNMLVTSASAGGAITPAPMGANAPGTALLMVVSGAAIDALDADNAVADHNISAFDVSWVKSAQLDSSDGSTLVVPTFESNFQVGAGQPLPEIPEIDIKIESVSVVAQTRKLRARWSPELAQDLNAYHSLDAEVELTQILSEQIALEIDREILNDLLVQADTNFFWDRRPGSFVNKRTGTAQARTSSLSTGPAFTGTVREWYETLVETIIDVANEIHRKTLRGSANFIVVSPDVATVLEASVLYKPNYSLDGDGQVSGMALGAESVGSLSNRFTVYKDPYFPRNKILVGFKGGSYLETGYVYAPYVPLIVTPTIFAPEDFTPRKGVMTRYGKKMVRNDFYGTVTCLGMDII
jgi:hypothetical protein